jgi:uncharacterized membrane-anchored protein
MLKKYITFVASFVLLLSLDFPVVAENELNWVQGPTTIDVGENLAEMKINEDYFFLNREDTITFQSELGNLESGLEIGSIYPISEEEDWFIIFEYDDATGYIKDAAKEDVDADKILKAYKKGNEQYNKDLEDQGFSPINVVGWMKEPHFDGTTQNFAWAMELESDGQALVNYNVRLLNRFGYVSAILVADADDLERLIPEVNDVLKGFSFKEGNRYEDFDPSKDKLAQFGLAALITGGVGAAAAKTGLIATLIIFAKKFGVIIIAVLAGIGTLFKKFLKRK